MNDNRQVLINLDAFIINTFPNAVKKGLEKACQLVENDAKKNCPVDDGVLRASLTHDVAEDASEGIVGTNVEYAPYVHEGTGIYAKNGNGRKTPWTYRSADGTYHTTKGQQAKPFLQEAVDSNYNNILKCFEGLI